VPGRKRGLAVDALGLIIAVVVTAASVTDTVIGVRLLDKVVEHTPTATRAWVDSADCVVAPERRRIRLNTVVSRSSRSMSARRPDSTRG
jgi:hypothetical protein